MATLKEFLNKDLQVSYVESYTPVSGAIVSPASGKTLTYAFFQVSADANITIVPVGSNVSVVVAVKGGIPYPYACAQITAVSAGTVYILHNNY